jgi:hypothetical protein
MTRDEIAIADGYRSAKHARDMTMSSYSYYDGVRFVYCMISVECGELIISRDCGTWDFVSIPPDRESYLRYILSADPPGSARRDGGVASPSSCAEELR